VARSRGHDYSVKGTVLLFPLSSQPSHFDQLSAAQLSFLFFLCGDFWSRTVLFFRVVLMRILLCRVGSVSTPFPPIAEATANWRLRVTVQDSFLQLLVCIIEPKRGNGYLCCYFHERIMCRFCSSFPLKTAMLALQRLTLRQACVESRS
jgi:hypothetical protein